MELVREISELRAVRRGWQDEGRKVGVVPTMGGLHEGHLGLVAGSALRMDRTIVTIFVNPTQFAQEEDLDAYPRTEAEDLELLAPTGCDLVFAPAPGEIYPNGFATSVHVEGLTDVLCGASRPHHFDGVALVVAKLLNQTTADAAFFGEKDWQQLQIITRMARDLDLPTRIVGCMTSRHRDGLARSTRNSYLTPEERAIAPILHQAISLAATRISEGAPTEYACAEAQESLTDAGFGSVEYLECRDAETLRLAPSPGEGARVFGAAQLGAARLIDNVAVPAR